jgi:hypothetical protein
MKIFDTPEDKSILSELADIVRTDHGRCWAPGLKCGQKPIRAHSVQNSKILERLQNNGAVSKIEIKVLNGETHIQFENVGRRKATTFRGLCGEHDALLFKKLDLEPLDDLSNDQKVLLTWRAITHEMAEKMAMAYNFQAKYQMRLKNGLVDGNSFDPFGAEAVAWLKVLYDSYNYREEFVTPILDGNQTVKRLIFKEFRISNTGPRIAASSFFTMDEYEQTHLAINVFPSHNDTVILFGIARPDVSKVMPILRSLLFRGKINTVALSSLMLSRLHNFVMPPSVVARWSNEKRLAIEETFSSTIDNYEIAEPTQIIDLFAD